LRVAHYYPRALVGDGGCTTAVRGWAAGLAAAGADVLVLCDGEGKPQEDDIKWRPIPHRRLGKFVFPQHIEPILAQADLLILHSGWVSHNVLAARSAVHAGTPYVITPHGAYDPNLFRRRKVIRPAWWRLLERRLLDRALAVHIFFEGERATLKRRGYEGPVVVAPNGVTVPPIGDEAPRGDYALWMGRFDVETKGIDLLLQAYARLPVDRRPQLRLHGPDWRGGRERTLHMIHELRLGGSVIIGPPIYGPEKWKTLHGARLFLFPSRWDSSSMMALEAAGAGVPIVATDSTFIARELANNGAAILVDATPASIAEAVLRVFSDPAQEIAADAANLVRERFSWPAVSQRLLDQLESLV